MITKPAVNQASFTKTELLKLKLGLPNKNEQSVITKILSRTDSAIEYEDAHKQKLLALKRGLMDDLLTAKVRINHLIKQ